MLRKKELFYLDWSSQYLKSISILAPFVKTLGLIHIDCEDEMKQASPSCQNE